MQILYDKGLFDNFQNPDKVLEDFLFTTRRRGDLEELKMSFNDFIRKYQLKKPTSNEKLYEVLKNIGLDSKKGIYLRDGKFSKKYGIFNLHPSRGTHWVCYIGDCYFFSYGITPPKQFLKYIKNGKCISPEHQIKKMIVFVEIIAYA